MTGHVLGIDPGPAESAYALVRPDYSIISAGKLPNATLFDVLCNDNGGSSRQVAVESLQSYGMPVGRSVFETAYQIGRILRQCEIDGLAVTLYPRQEYARAICGTARVSDAILRQALLLRFGGDGKGEPLALLRGNTDKRSAYGVAAYHIDLLRLAGRIPGVAMRTPHGMRSNAFPDTIGTLPTTPKAGGGEKRGLPGARRRRGKPYLSHES